MTPKHLPAFLARKPLFAGLDPEEVAQVTARMELVDVPAGAVIFSQGDPGDGWYVVVRGEVAIRMDVPDVGEHELARLESGEEFGEMALIDDHPRLASAVAEVHSTLARLPRAAFHEILDAESHLGARLVLAMARVLCQRQRELTGILTDLVDDPETAPPGPREMLSLLLIPRAH